MRSLYAAAGTVAVTVASAMAQYSGFATNSDGKIVLLATSYRQSGTEQTADPKLFRIENGQVSFLGSQTCDPVRLTGACGIEDLQASGGGAVVYQSRIPCIGGSSCEFRERTVSVLLKGDERRSFAGRIRISRNGRYIAQHDLSGVPAEAARISRLIDLETGASAELGADLRYRTGVALRVADDGAVLMSEGWLVRPNARVQLPKPEGSAVMDVDAQASIVLAESARESLFAIDVRGGRYRQIGPADRASYGGSISADGKWVLYISVIGETPQLFFSSIDGQIWRQLTVSDEGIDRAVLSDDARVALVLTRGGALLRMATSTGAAEKIVGPLPRDVRPASIAVPGSLNVLKGRGLSAQETTASGPWPEELGGVRLTIDGTAMRLHSVSPTEIVFQVPWEIPLSQAPLVVHRDAEVFEAAIPIGVRDVVPLRLAVVHENFGSVVSADNPARPGEIVHLYATGLGRAEPTPPSGEPTALAPLSQLVNGWTFVWGGFAPERSAADVSFAGLAPALVGVYQIDLRIPERQPYDLSFVNPAGNAGFGFLTLPVGK